MSTYHLLILDGDKTVRIAQALESEDDDRAIVDAAKFIGRRRAELWEGNRLVRSFEPRPFYAS
jgi:hypothetical protein